MVCIIGIIFMPTGPTGRNSTSSTLRLLLLIFVRGTIESDSKKIWNQMKEQLSETSGKFWESVPERAASSFIFHEKRIEVLEGLVAEVSADGYEVETSLF